jgi:hypothetical protein
MSLLETFTILSLTWNFVIVFLLFHVGPQSLCPMSLFHFLHVAIAKQCCMSEFTQLKAHVIVYDMTSCQRLVVYDDYIVVYDCHSGVWKRLVTPLFLFICSW